MKEGVQFDGAFSAIQYIKNEYALVGFIFLVLIIAIAMTDLKKEIKAPTVLILAALVILMSTLLLRDVFVKAREDAQFHLVRNEGPVLIAKGVKAELVDVETLKGGKSGSQEFNRRVDPAIVARVLERAGVLDLNAEQALAKSDSAWSAYLATLEPTKAEHIKQIPFAKVRITINGVEDTSITNRWFLKHDVITVPASPNGLQLVNVYNTKNDASFEPEAVNVKLQ